MTRKTLSLLLLLALVITPMLPAEPWTTYRGDLGRSGNPEGKAGPATPKVLWVYKSKEHYIASPVIHKDRLYVSGLSFINTSILYCFDTAVKTDKRIVWQKSSPLLELPTVSSPAIWKGNLIFGDGMHQTNGASIYCMGSDKGTPLWQLKIEGTLVHLEGSPTIVEDRVYLGGGAAGVVCVDPTKVKLDGKELAIDAVANVMEAKREELQKAFDAKKKDDPFAVPPSDADLPKPTPNIVWQKGKTAWHVDAPVTVVEGKVLVASAFLDKEMVGKRALICLDAKSGEEKWSADLSINPWGGPSVQGKTVVVTGSSIGYDPAAIKGSKGVVAAFDLDTGKPKWKKDLPGGVVSCAALSKDVAVVVCTDGKVRAYNLNTGAIRWTYTAGPAIFAPPAIDAESVYVGDLKGIVHAINLRTGASKWKLDLGEDSAIASPGMIYAGPIIDSGRLYVTTCNIAGDFVNKPTAIICIGEK
jgi:outer membrane protein assembly factor BamB